MVEQDKPDLNFVVDFRFVGIEAELSVILEHRQSIERRLPGIIESERKRLEEDLKGAEPDEWYGSMQWIDEFADEVLPRLYRSPILIQLWASFESGFIEVAKYIRDQEKPVLTLGDLRASNDFERAIKYYDHVLHFSLIEIAGVNETLEMLLLVRNAIAHCNGRIEMIKPTILQKIRRWEDRGISVGVDYIGFTADFVEAMAETVQKALNDLIARVRDKY